MSSNSFFEKLRSFLGYPTVNQPPRNDFRNPIWGSDDDDDGDELYSRQQMDVFSDPLDIQREFSRQVQDMFKSFGSLLGDMRSIFHEDDFRGFDSYASITEPPTDHNNPNNLRDYYLKPGYHNDKHESSKMDIDLDGKISSCEISGLLNQKEDNKHGHKSIAPFDGNLVPGRSFCRTVITTSVTKPDGSIETRKIIKNGNEVIEEITTSRGPDSRNPTGPSGLDTVSNAGVILSNLSSLFTNYY